MRWIHRSLPWDMFRQPPAKGARAQEETHPRPLAIRSVVNHVGHRFGTPRLAMSACTHRSASCHSSPRAWIASLDLPVTDRSHLEERSKHPIRIRTVATRAGHGGPPPSGCRVAKWGVDMTAYTVVIGLLRETKFRPPIHSSIGGRRSGRLAVDAEESLNQAGEVDRRLVHRVVPGICDEGEFHICIPRSEGLPQVLLLEAG